MNLAYPLKMTKGLIIIRFTSMSQSHISSPPKNTYIIHYYAVLRKLYIKFSTNKIKSRDSLILFSYVTAEHSSSLITIKNFKNLIEYCNIIKESAVNVVTYIRVKIFGLIIL